MRLELRSQVAEGGVKWCKNEGLISSEVVN